jgi:hypothetical protein
MSKAFCSRSCKDNYFQLIAIQIPKLFLKRLYQFCTPEEREKEIEDFAIRHKWRLDLLKNKIEEEASRLKYVKENKS